jgi:hypothetical protein
MHLNWSNYVLPLQEQNVSVNDHLLNLFIDEWSTQMSYSKYFDECRPSICTYTARDKINLSYTITLFISLYGGLTIILRLVASFLVNYLWKCHLRNTNVNSGNF